jgi:hypothetical protein
MSQQIFFAHANGFPSATYGKLFAALAPDYEVGYLAQHATTWPGRMGRCGVWATPWGACCTCMRPCAARSITGV